MCVCHFKRLLKIQTSGCFVYYSNIFYKVISK